MKSVLLFRHADATFDVKYKNDYERPLTHEGIEDAKKIGQYLAQFYTTPDIVVTSSATRALETITYAIKSGKWNSKLKIEKQIYGGRPDFLLILINEQQERYDSLCLVGHEPNFSLFVSKATDISYFDMPTASVVKINFDVEQWNEVVFGFGSLEYFIKSKELQLKIR